MCILRRSGRARIRNPPDNFSVGQAEHPKPWLFADSILARSCPKPSAEPQNTFRTLYGLFPAQETAFLHVD